MKNSRPARLILEDGTVFHGFNFGSEISVSGEIVFTTGMVGYPESMTDPSYSGQILCFTYPLIGNYGVPDDSMQHGLHLNFESGKIHTKAIVVSDYSEGYSHHKATRSLHGWMQEHGIPGIYGIDTRALTKILREKGTMLGKVICDDSDLKFYDPSSENLVADVSIKEKKEYGTGNKKIVLIDCGCKNNIIRSFLRRDVRIIRVPWDYDFEDIDYDGLFISNGPGDPKMCKKTISNLKKALLKDKPIWGICLGNQLLALAAGADTYKLKYGHRSQNQPCIEEETGRCFMTSQNHGYAVDHKRLPKDWKIAFRNANDMTVEGIKHKKLPFFSVQFHPEATPGPTDTDFLFDRFISML